ncbi:glutathione S-transferase [Backusella circina FSU 941]|nr:glutathione S-transferase [Backusella circina FSU 941]KAI8885589.1 glutathione S-transferase [Backusella circina FSU 941]
MSSLSNIKLYYYPFPGRSEYVKLLLDDANVDYETFTITKKDWPQKKAELMEEGIPVPTLPYLLVNGQYIGNTAPIMRYLSKQLGNYLGENDLENHLLDCWADIGMDWFLAWVDAHYLPTSNEETEKKYHSKDGRGPLYHKSFESILAKSSGPYVLGEKISYVDFIVYHSCVEDGLYKIIDVAKYPNLKKLFDAIDSRPTLKKHFSKN